MRNALGAVESVLVLGGTSDIGRAIARALVLERDARRVVLAGRDDERLQEAAAGLASTGADVAVEAGFDAVDTAGHEAFLDQVWQRHGDLDVVVLAFGLLGDQGRGEQDVRHALEIVDVNFRGAVSAGTLVGQRLRDQGHGALVVLSTIAAVQPRRANYLYGAAKAGLDAFSRGLSDALAPDGVQVLTVRPGFVHSSMTEGMEEAPLATTPEEVAEVVLAGLDRRATTIHAPRPVGAVGAVLRNLPRAVVRKLPR